MKTYFAPAERSSRSELTRLIPILSKNPVINGLLTAVSGLLAVLNEHRQILALNETLLEMIGIDDAGKALGLRLGEALQCVHAHEMAGGCGTTELCSTCGAAISMVVSLSEDRPVEKTCALTARKGDREEDFFLRVRSCPMTFDDRRFLLLFMQDITHQQTMAGLEQVFFHDFNNMLQNVISVGELVLLKRKNTSELTRRIYRLSLRLAREITIQRCLTQTGSYIYQPLLRPVPVKQIFQEVRDMFYDHSVAKKKLLNVPERLPDLSFKTDISLLMRVLNNMVKNAFEATAEGDEVRFSLELSHDSLTFCVWNRQAISESVKKRIFQRNFSTKSETGRGLGTYAMKLLGEKFLAGKVNFTSSESEGTMFRISLPFDTGA